MVINTKIGVKIILKTKKDIETMRDILREIDMQSFMYLSREANYLIVLDL